MFTLFIFNSFSSNWLADNLSIFNVIVNNVKEDDLKRIEEEKKNKNYLFNSILYVEWAYEPQQQQPKSIIKNSRYFVVVGWVSLNYHLIVRKFVMHCQLC